MKKSGGFAVDALALVTSIAMGACSEVEGSHAALPGSPDDPSHAGPGSQAAAQNGIKDGRETDIDCGGGSAPPCADGKGCTAASDCVSAVCSAGVCQAPTKTDNAKNGSETDVDCGGQGPTNAPACGDGKWCKVHADCVSDACSYSGRCLPTAQKSCTRHEGGDTCGPKGDESCCVSLAVPTAGNVSLDKYAITAGRMRTFVERTNGHIRQFMIANPPVWWNQSFNQYLPTELDAGVAGYDGVYQQLGGDVYGRAGPTNQACWIGTGEGQIGARTYWLPKEANDVNGGVQLYDQRDLDERALNCVTAYMIAAFCAWEGARLPTRDELDKAWGDKKYPWGDAPSPAGWYSAPESDPGLTPGTMLWTSGLSEFGNPPTCTYSGAANTPCDPFHANYVYNYWGGKTRKGNDYSIHLAPPGRFPLGNGPHGHADLAGLVFNYTTIASGNTQWSKNGSFQGHDIPWTTFPSTRLLTAPATNKYWTAGGRCAR